MRALEIFFQGYIAVRDVIDGSVFIKVLCNKIDQLADTEDLLGVLTQVMTNFYLITEILITQLI